VTCLPAQAVACRLAGLLPPAAKNSAADSALFEEMVKDAKFRIRVESVSGKEGVTVVQASTLDRPAVNINRRLAEAKPQRLAANSSSSSEPLEVIVTHVSSGSIFGQPRYESRPLCWLCFCRLPFFASTLSIYTFENSQSSFVHLQYCRRFSSH
jgi:hypothetical protein